MIRLYQDLHFDKERLNSFFNRQNSRNLSSIVNSYRRAFIIGITLLGISIFLFASMSAQNHFVPWNFLSGFCGITYLVKGFIRLTRHNKLFRLSKKEIAEYFERNQDLQTATYKIGEEKLEYFENGAFKEKFLWQDLTDVITGEESFTMFFDEPRKSIFIVESEVEQTFYRDFLELAIEKNVR